MKIKLIKARPLVGKRILLTIMRTFIFLLCTTVFSLSPTNSFSQKKIEIKTDRVVSVNEVFNIIEQQTDYRFIYPQDLFTNAPKIQLRKGKIKIANLLKTCLLGSKLDFKLSDKNTIEIVEHKKTKQIPSQIELQEFTVNGAVSDSNGQPLPGANVLEKGTTNGTQTNFDGKFSLTVSDLNVTLVVSYLGFLTTEIVLDGQTEISISLEEDKGSLDEVVLVGYKYQAASTIRAKQESVQIADFLTQDNIGRLPDFAAADAARRIAGVNTVFEEDEATQVGLRGLPPIYTFATIDGLAIPSADRNTRVANFEVIPSSSVARIEVYKSRTANLDGNAIGGVFNLKTRSAFDSEERVIVGSFSVGDYNFDDVPRSSRNDANKNGASVRSDFTYSDRFGKSNQFGVVFSGSYNRKDRDELKHPRANWSFANGDQTKPTPSRLRTNAYDNIINRYGGFVKLEYKPSENFYIGVSGSFFKKEDSEIRYESRIDNLEFDEASLTPTGGRFTAGRSRLSNNIFEIEHKVSNIIFDTYYKFDDKNKIDFKFGYAEGFRGEDGPGATYRTGTLSDFSGTFSVDDEGLSYTLDNPDFYADAANYPLSGIGGFTRLDDEDFTSFSFNYGHNMESDSKGWGFKTGYKYRTLNHLFDSDNLSVSYNGTEPLDLTQFILNENFQPDVLGQPLPLFDPYAINSFITNNPSLFDIPSNSQGTKFGRGIVDDPGSEFNIEETINAFYGMIAYRSDKFQFSGGLRYEDTKTTTSRPRQVDGVYDNSRSENKNDFGNLLPSLSMTLDLSEKVKLKAAYSKGIGRADYGQLSPSEVVDIANDLIQKGNPDLKPRRSDSFDTSVEYYFKSGSVFSLGAFHKDIKDDIQTESTFDGTTEIFTPFNIDGFAVTGIELNFIKSDFKSLQGFLSNFGIISNYTFIVGERFLNDGQRLASVANLPRHTINAQLFYQAKKWDSRLAWNWVDKTLTSIRTGQEFNNRYLAARNQLDWAANFKVNKTVSVFGEIRNLTGANRTFLGGPDQSLTEEVTEYGSSFWLGLSFNF
ncbi:TonB-dependent receptor [Flavobacteriaceae bacterium]|nr:TonB-dependent receptor [Flavobacteriaceae bacterium]